LKDELSKYPDDMDVFVDERTTGFTYGLVNSVCSKNIPFTDGDNSLHAEDTVVVISEE
jgi:hypothetical protein